MVAAWVVSGSVLALGSAVAFGAAQLSPPVDQPFQLSWIWLAAGFALAERFAVHLEVRREAHTIAFSEVPLVLGLVFADPSELVVARVVAGIATVALVRRQPPVKLTFNAGQLCLDVGVALVVFHTILGAAEAVEPRGWVAGVGAVAISHLVGAVAVSAVMRAAGAPVTLRSQLSVVAVSLSAALAGAAVAMGASGPLWREGRSWILLLVIGGALGYFFISFVRIRERHQDLFTLHGFTSSLALETDSHRLGADVAAGFADLLRSTRVVLLVPNGDAILRIDHTDGSTTFDDDHEVGETDWNGAVAGAGSRLQVAPGWVLAGVQLESDSVITATLPMPGGTGLVIIDGRLSSVRAFDEEDVQLLETAAGHAASALNNAQLVERLRDEAQFRAHQALHDDVTDLPNQRALMEQLDGQLAAGTELAMVTVRVNSLREVNETLGRKIGDEMLRQVAARLKPVGRRAWCARSANDEFTLIVPGGQSAADEFSDRIVEAFELPVLCDEVALAVIVGIGVALSPEHGVDSDTLLRRASLAASRTALDGTTVTTWASDRDPYDPQRLTIAADLRDAIPSGELEVHFQPQFDVVNGLVTGAEALVRWKHPRLGQLRPDQFIAAAENTGAIDALTLHVLTVAAMTGVKWREMGWDLDMGVNLSARNLTNPNFASDVATILERTGMPARSLTMELTESSVMTEAERALRTLHELDELGIAISIDDFGTGYSSLAHLRRLPVGEIKIDKSFVFDLTTSESDEAIVRSMIELGHNLGLTVVVEGVETVEVRDRLYELGTDRLQGYLLSRPLPAEAFEHWVSERPIRTLVESPKDRVVQLQQRRG